MKAIINFVIIVILFISSIFSLHAQSTEGKDFWLTFGKNHSAVFISSINLQIRIASGNQATEGTFYFTNLEYKHSFSIGAQQVYTYTLNDEQKQAVYNTTEGVSNLSIHIETKDPVTAFAMNYSNAYIEATNILPVSALGNNYRQISYVPSNSQYLDAYAVVATEDNTTVLYNGGASQKLNAGQVFYKTSPTDMTGTLIKSDKPVAFFALNQCAKVPEGYAINDPLIQQLAPIETWGKNFFVPVSNQGKNITRIVASQDGTDITQTGGTLLSPTGGQSSLLGLQAGQFVELEVSIANSGCFIKSNKPVGICTYLPSQSYTGSGDPAQCWLPAIEQTTPKTLIAPFLVNAITSHYALVSTPTDTKNNTLVSIGDAAPVALNGGSWVDNSTAEMSFYAMPLTNSSASYLFTNPAGIIVLCYGLGGASSYYYLAGSAMRDLTAAFYVNDFHYLEIPETFSCTEEIDFRAEIDGLNTSEGSLKWYINGKEEEDARDQLSWKKSLAKGVYEIEMWVRFENYETASYTCSLTIEGLWIKIKNVKY